MVKLDADAVWEFADAITQTANPTPQKRPATVQSVDADGTVWVQVAGADNVTPVTTSNAMVAPGDVVTVEQRGASLHVEGNITDPAAGGKVVYNLVAPIRAKLTQAADDADAAKLAAKAAQEAAEAASAANQHFWDDSNGAHVTEVEKDAWTDPQSADYHSGHNLLMNSLGILLRKALNNLASITQSAIAFFDGTGNAASNIVASFGTDGFQAGKADESHLVGDYHSLKMMNKEGRPYFHASDLRDRSGVNSYTVLLQPSISHVTGELMTIGAVYDIDSFNSECTVLFDGEPYTGTVAPIYDDPDGYFASVFGWKPIVGVTVGESVTGQYDRWTMLVEAENAFEIGLTFGERNPDKITAGGSSVFGSYCEASGFNSFATGMTTKAIGAFSKADGIASTSRGLCAEASGRESNAKGDYSHAQNHGTKASSANQTAIGSYNIEDTNGTYALIVGNGQNANARSNAHTLDWSGNADYAGEVTAHSGSTAHNLTDKADASDLADLAAEVADIGDNVSKDISTTVQSSTSTWTSVGSIDLAEGIWVVIAGLQFSSNGTGYRYISLNNADGTPAAAWTRATRNSVPAISGNATVLHTSHIITAGSSGTTIHLMGWHNSGTQLNLTGRLNAVRIKG